MDYSWVYLLINFFQTLILFSPIILLSSSRHCSLLSLKEAVVVFVLIIILFEWF